MARPITALFARLFAKIMHTGCAFEYAFTREGAKFFVATDTATRKSMFSDGVVAYVVGYAVYARSRRALTGPIIRHELTHIRQLEDGGLAFLIDYGLEQCTRGYARNRYEIQARRAERSRRR